jgi:enoyl-CoA hydratase/carnithine racemase
VREPFREGKSRRVGYYAACSSHEIDKATQREVAAGSEIMINTKQTEDGMAGSIEKNLVGGVLHLEFTSDDGRNTMDDDWFARLDQALADAAGDRKVRVVLLSSRGAAFCSGMNLRHAASGFLSEGFGGSPLACLSHRLADFSKPLLAAVHGYAVGGGATLLLHCDLVVAAADTRFRLPFASLGIAPEIGSSYLLPRAAGPRLANELVLLGKLFDAQTAQRAGFVNAVVEPGSELAMARQWAEDLTAQAPNALVESRRLLREEHLAGVHAAIDREGEALFAAVQFGEFGEAVAAFLEKRPPDFSRF